MSNRELETKLCDLLEKSSLEDVVFSLFRYAEMQASLAKTLQQSQAANLWQNRAYQLGSIQLGTTGMQPCLHEG